MIILDNTVCEIENGQDVCLAKGFATMTFQYTGTGTVAVTGSVDGETYTPIAAASLSDYSTVSGSLGAGIYKIMLIGGIVRVRFAFASGTVVASAE